MSDERKDELTPASTPPTEVPAAPADPSTKAEASVTAEAPAKDGTPATTGTTPQVAPRPPGPIIDYALPAHKKSWLPSPAMIRNIGCLMKMMVGFTVMLCMGYFALVALNPKARQWALQGTKAGPNGAPPTGKGPTPFKALNQVLAIPAQAMGKTDDVVKANNARVGLLDGVIKEEEGKAKGGAGSRANRPVVDPFASPAASAPEKKATTGATETAESGPQAVSAAALLALAEKRAATNPSSELPAPSVSPIAPRPSPLAPAPDTPDQMKLAGDIVIAQASPAGAPRASAAFFYWVVKLNVGGITQGKPARALINNRLAYEGDEVNRPLGIVFAQLDSANKLLLFRDNTGAVVTRSY